MLTLNKRNKIFRNTIAKNPQLHCGFFLLAYNSFTVLQLQAEQNFRSFRNEFTGAANIIAVGIAFTAGHGKEQLVSLPVVPLACSRLRPAVFAEAGACITPLNTDLLRS